MMVWTGEMDFQESRARREEEETLWTESTEGEEKRDYQDCPIRDSWGRPDCPD